jgi:hypothetical protein
MPSYVRTGHMLSIGECLAGVKLTTHRLLPLKFRSANYVVMTRQLKGLASLYNVILAIATAISIQAVA